jgi:hypothetical protein
MAVRPAKLSGRAAQRARAVDGPEELDSAVTKREPAWRLQPDLVAHGEPM